MKKEVFLLGVLFMIVAGNARGQEYSAILGTYVGGSWSGLKNQYSIIREVDSAQRMVFTYYEGQMTFSLYSDGSTNVLNYADWGDYPSTFIYDFEILKDTVYYCGQRNNNAMVGKFCYTSLPSVSFQEYYSDPSLRLLKFDRLDVYDNGGEIRVVTVGSYQDGMYCIGEYVGDGSNISVANPIDPREVFDDVAVTDGYIVTVSRLPDCSTGYYRLFKKPAPVVDMFNYNSVVTNIAHAIDFQVDDKLILEHCEGDYFAVAVKSSESNGTVVGAYDPLGYAAKVMVYSVDYEHLPIDIKYDRITKQLHLLQRSKYNEGLVSHLNSAMVSGVGTVPGHLYLGHDLFSIDRVSASAGTVIATGRPNISGYPSITWIHKMNAAIWKSCTEKKTIQFIQPKGFVPCVLGVGLSGHGAGFLPRVSSNTIEDYYKTVICE